MKPFRVVVTGSECTGKTTLARALAEHFHAPWSAEFVREWVDSHGRAPTLEDIRAIAAGQADGEDAAVREARAVVVHDTDLLSTVVYSRHYFGGCPDEVEQAARSRRPHLYLLAGIDVPWSADGNQRDRPHQRVELQAQFSAAAAASGAPCIQVAGNPDDRLRAAIAAMGRVRREGSS
jgi:NadR type nicotinamide-nucleotide adenylyltransferase